MKSFLFALLAVGLGLELPTAMAQTAGVQVAGADVTVQLLAQRVEPLANGQEKFASADHARPGDIIEYQAIYTNRGKAAARNLAATLPVPATGLEYLEGSSSPKANLASLDGKRYEAIPLTRVIKQFNGPQLTQRVPASEYRYLRWNLGELAAGASVTLRARMRVSTQFPATVAAR